FDTACEARFALERACAPMTAARREPAQLAIMRREIKRQSEAGLTDEAFCASDVAFHRALVDGAQNPVLSYQLSGSIEAMQPLMNMITFTARSRAEIVEIHTSILDAIVARDSERATEILEQLERVTKRLAHSVMDAKAVAIAKKEKPEVAQVSAE
ncbi:MAG: FCD domain-containing protein, partial [Boseongicola sp.]|nr:FCD domain-containing protein [Boseongicola sp.]